MLLCRDVPFRPLQVVTWEGRSEMKGERIERRELGGDRHDAQVERMESNGKTVGWETRSGSTTVSVGSTPVDLGLG